MTFPATYGMSIIDSCIGTTVFAFPVPPDDSMKVISHIHYTETIDGWGTATTPTGSYQCLRDIAVRNHVDSTFSRNSTSGTWSLYNAPSTKTDTFYFWYSNNQAFLIAEIQIQENLPKQGFYLFSQAVGIQENAVHSEINIFPNPFSLQTVLQTDNSLFNATLTVDNCFGQTVAQIKNISGQTIVFNRDNLASGLYFVRLTQDGNTISADKFVIVDE